MICAICQTEIESGVICHQCECDAINRGRRIPSLPAPTGSATLLQQLKWNLWWRGPIHGAICWYLQRCSGAFHHHHYGAAGRYVVLMTDEQYHRYTASRRTERIAKTGRTKTNSMYDK